MKIDEFINKSIGEWKSMRTSHTLSFYQFENIISKINVEALKVNDPEVKTCLEIHEYSKNNFISPFKMYWEGESDWKGNNDSSLSSGSSVLVPVPSSESEGIMLRSQGYAENTKAISNYKFLPDQTLILSTIYSHSITEEKIWFASDNVRCRSSIVRTKGSQALLQTSFASEIRRIII